jgi:hypothetical protein
MSSSEFAQRHSLTLDVLAYLQARPAKWVQARTLAKIGGFCGWRTRVSQARKIAERDGSTIQWNGQVKDSQYRFLRHKPIGPDAAIYRAKTLPF